VPILARTTAGVLAGLLAGTLGLAFAPSSTAVSTTMPSSLVTAETDREPCGTVMEAPRHSSDGVRGAIAPEVPRFLRSGEPEVFDVVRWQVAPGIQARSWSQRDPGRPVKIRAHLVEVDLAAPGVTFDHLAPRFVARRQVVSKLAGRAGAVAAVNGDFFDISDTGAPLGVGKLVGEHLRHGSRHSWVFPDQGNPSFYIDEDGPHVGPLRTVVTLRQRPDWRINFLNSPTVRSGGIGAYLSTWGRTRGYSVTDGERRGVREVVVVRGRVVSNRPRLSRRKRIEGQVLIGRGRGARKLSRLRVGQRLRLTARLEGEPQLAISGDRPLLVDGERVVVDDRQMHPRTAIGIDRDAEKLLLLVIDGRQKGWSRGYTMVELARMMTDLGAEDALNLDGGGSSTLYGRARNADLRVLNRPSDGVERRVANAFGVFYTPPA
jgi:hypothetical protein